MVLADLGLVVAVTIAFSLLGPTVTAIVRYLIDLVKPEKTILTVNSKNISIHLGKNTSEEEINKKLLELLQSKEDTGPGLASVVKKSNPE